MKPGLAILPLEVWADVSEHPLLTRQLMAQIADNNGDPVFTSKLQKLLHGCGKQTLHYLDISSKQSDKTTEEPEIPECPALLAVSQDHKGWESYVRERLSTYKECEFPETDCEIPENIKTFNRLSIRHIDDEVLAFLNKIKPLFNNVYLVIYSRHSAPNDIQIVLTQLLPMLGGIRGIACDDIGMELLERQFPETLALTKELDLFDPKLASIPACLDWLSAPLDFHMLGRIGREPIPPTVFFNKLDTLLRDHRSIRFFAFESFTLKDDFVDQFARIVRPIVSLEKLVLLDFGSEALPKKDALFKRLLAEKKSEEEEE